MKKTIKWTPKFVDTKKIQPTPNNYKIKTDLGKERLSMSMNLFGNAAAVIVNTDYKLIDGNSRLEEEKEKGTKKMWVMMPDRKLSPKEYQEMSAMFDFAKAGEVDIDRIRQELGVTKDFYDRWKDEMPMHLLDKLGKNAKVPKAAQKEEAYPEEVGDAVAKKNNIVMVNLFFNAKQEEEFRKYEEKLMKKWKTINTMETVMKAMKTLAK